MHFVLTQKLKESKANPIKIHLTEDETRIGRSTQAPLAQYPQISREHAVFYKDDTGSLFIKDLDSLNGVFVNGTKIRKSLHPLSIGDIIGFGVPFLEGNTGFICVLSKEGPEVKIKQEVIDLTDDEPYIVPKPVTNLNFHVQPSTSKNVSILNPKVELCENGIKNTSRALNSFEAAVVDSDSSSLKSNTSSSHHNLPNRSVNFQHCFQNDNTIEKSPVTSQNSIRQPSKKTMPVKTCYVELVKCDSKHFEYPTDVQNPYLSDNPLRKQKAFKQCNKVHIMSNKTPVIKLYSDSSDSNSDDASALSPFNINQNIALGILNIPIIKNRTEVSDNDKNIALSRCSKRKLENEEYSSSPRKVFLSNDEDKDDFSNSSFNNKTKTHEPQIVMSLHKENNANESEKPGSSDEEVCYSQVQEIIYISDDDSYLDFSSSQTVHIKEEPLDMLEDISMSNEDDICKEIFDSNSEFESLPHHVIAEVNHTQDNIESIESIKAFVDSVNNSQNYIPNLPKDSNVLPPDDYFPVLSQAFESSEGSSCDDDSELVTLCSTKFSIGNKLVENSAEKKEILENRDKKIDSNLDSGIDKAKSIKKSIGRTLLTEPKPLQNRPRKMRGKEEGFKEQEKYEDPHTSTPQKQDRKSKKTKEIAASKTKKPASKKPSSIKLLIGKSNSNLATFKIPRKTNNQVPVKEQSGNSSKDVSLSKSQSSSVVNVSVKKAPSVKTRPEKFGSRSGFLVDDIVIKPKRGKQTVTDKKVQNKFKEDNKSVAKQSAKNDQSVQVSKMSKSDLMQNASRTEVSANISFNVPITSYQKPLIPNPRDPRQRKLTNSVQGNVSNIPSISMPCTSKAGPVRSTSNAYNRSGTSNAFPMPSTSKAVSSVRTASTDRRKLFEKQQLSNRINSKLPYDISYFGLIKTLINLMPVWLEEQAKFKNQPPSVVKKGATDLPIYYDSFESYASSFYPMIMLEIWECMYAESKEVFKSKKAFKKFYFCVISYTSRDDHIELKCESVIYEKEMCMLQEGNIVTLELREKGKNSKKIQCFFGYIFKHKIEPLNVNTRNKVWLRLPKEMLGQSSKYFTFSVYIRKKVMSFELDTLMKGNGICYVRSKLRLADALMNVKHSILLKDILKPSWPTFLVDYTPSSPSREYTAGQMQVINGISSEVNKSKFDPKIILVQGPPGTGKTHTIIGLLEKLVFNSKFHNKILVVAPSNAAIDEIGCRLIELKEQYDWKSKNTKFVRIGIERQVHEKMKPFFLDRVAKSKYQDVAQTELKRNDKDLCKLKDDICQLEKKGTHPHNETLKYLKEQYKILKEQMLFKNLDYVTEMNYKISILKESHIVLSTLNSCGLSVLLKTFRSNSDVQFSCCIMDESTQCTELEVLQPLIFGINKLVLVGDPEQLPATVLSKLARDYKLQRSMFERFHLFFKIYYNNSPSPTYTLAEQFRMHSAICAFPSKQFYDNKVVTDPDTDIRYKQFPFHPYIVLDILSSQESSESSSKFNCNEASVIANICKFLLDVIDFPSSIGIITPYQGQRSLYMKALYQNPRYRSIEINTVDGFQGREKEIIILSSVRANSENGTIGFLSSSQRLNVAITRAKKLLIICAHTVSLILDTQWSALIADARARNLCVPVTSAKDIPYIFNTHLRKKK